MNIYEVQAKNKRLTWLLFFLFFLLFLAVGLGFDFFYTNAINNVHKRSYRINSNGYYELTPSKKKFYPIATIIALLFSLIMIINSIINGSKMVLTSTRARKADPLNEKEKQFINIVSEMSIASGFPMPEAYIVPDQDLNAFATGFSPNKSYIAVTEGLISVLNREELQGVISHEMSHIKNYDIRLMTIASALMNAIALISDWAIRTSRYKSSSNSKSKSGGILFLLWLFLIILAPLISRLIALSISRKREFLADASGAELTRNPKALISALEKIRNSIQPTYSVNNGIAHMCITDPRGSLIEEREGLIGDLFATHPPMEKRILALKVMSYQLSKKESL